MPESVTYEPYVHRPLPENLSSIKQINEHFDHVRTVGIPMAQSLVESDPFKAAECLLKIREYLSIQPELCRSFVEAEVKRAREAGVVRYGDAHMAVMRSLR